MVIDANFGIFRHSNNSGVWSRGMISHLHSLCASCEGPGFKSPFVQYFFAFLKRFLMFFDVLVGVVHAPQLAACHLIFAHMFLTLGKSLASELSKKVYFMAVRLFL